MVGCEIVACDLHQIECRRTNKVRGDSVEVCGSDSSLLLGQHQFRYSWNVSSINLSGKTFKHEKKPYIILHGSHHFERKPNCLLVFHELRYTYTYSTRTFALYSCCCVLFEAVESIFLVGSLCGISLDNFVKLTI